MSLISDLIDSVKKHNRNTTVQGVLIGLYWTMVTSRKSGLAATISDESCCKSREMEDTGHLQDKNVFELMEYLYSSHPLEVSIGMAALNSLLEYNEHDVREVNARDIIAEKSLNKNVVIIGHFPFLDMLREKANNLWVLELNPGPGELDASEYVNFLPKADVIGLTATTLMNGTFDDLHRYFPAGATVVMMGPSTPMSTLLFDYGIDVIAGSRVTDSVSLSRYIGQGTTLHKVEGLQRVTIIRK